MRMEGGQPPTWQSLRDLLGHALDRAHDYCDEIAPTKYIGCLFVDAKETPVEADDEAIIAGTAKAMRLRDFGLMPTIGDQRST